MFLVFTISLFMRTSPTPPNPFFFPFLMGYGPLINGSHIKFLHNKQTNEQKIFFEINKKTINVFVPYLSNS